MLSGRTDVVEKKMVGGLSFVVNGNMCCGITGTALMVRVGADSREQALREPHVQPMLFADRALNLTTSSAGARLRAAPAASGRANPARARLTP